MQTPIPLPICGRNNSNKENIIDAASISIIPACSIAGLMGMGLMIMVSPKIPKDIKNITAYNISNNHVILFFDRCQNGSGKFW